ncbi:MAG: T9SS C-terminal target domain-containing protein [Flavobacteriia bacterium]|nr:T9SS C-terminal target domain-containing protein [Flavobacteriia bacterium]
MIKFYALFFTFFVGISFSYAQCTTENSIGCECKDSDEIACDLLPDITVSWQWGIGDYEEFPPGEGLQSGEINYPDNWFEITPEVEAMGRIRVGARTPNIGSGPLNLRGADKDGYRWMICYDSGVADTFSVYDPDWNEESYCPDGSTPKHISIQRVYQKKADGSMGFYEVMVGTMEYHPTHGHMHFNEWTIMSLRIPDPNNMENPLEWEIVGDGAKVGFCVMDLGNCSSENAGCRDDESVYNEGTLLSQDDFPNYGLGGGGYGCSPVSQGISVGYNDTYGSYLDGMFLNIPLGTCNGDYAVVLEVPQVMLEERLDNNFTWFPVTLTQQTGVPNVPEITSSATNLVCEGDNISLSIDAPDNTTLLWSDGSTSESIEINQAGTYSVTVTSEEFSCPTTKNIVVSTISNPSLESVTVCKNENAELSVESEYDVTWYDESMNVVGSGLSFTTPILNESVNYYVTSSFSDNNVGPEQHEGGSNYSGGSNAIGFLSFDALSSFTLESVSVYTEEPAERKFILMNEAGEVVAEHTEFIGFCADEPQVVELNFEVPAGTNYQIGTDAEVNVSSVGGENPQLKRTGTNGGLSYPYVLDGKVSINKAVYYGQGMDDSGGDDYTTYYYYLYNWVIAGEPIECDPVVFPVTVEDCSSIDEVLVDMSVYPNPTEGLVAINLSLETESNVGLTLSNSIGQSVYYENLGKLTKLDKSFDWSMLPKGIYTISFNINNQKTFEKIVLQ